MFVMRSSFAIKGIVVPSRVTLPRRDHAVLKSTPGMCVSRSIRIWSTEGSRERARLDHRNSTRWALSNLHNAIQSGSIGKIVSNPKGVQFGTRQEALFLRHIGPFSDLSLLGLLVAGEDLGLPCHFQSIPRRSSRPRLASNPNASNTPQYSRIPRKRARSILSVFAHNDGLGAVLSDAIFRKSRAHVTRRDLHQRRVGESSAFQNLAPEAWGEMYVWWLHRAVVPVSGGILIPLLVQHRNDHELMGLM